MTATQQPMISAIAVCLLHFQAYSFTEFEGASAQSLELKLPC